MIFRKNNLWWMAVLSGTVIYFALAQPKPCDAPIKYKIGTIDEGFGLSQERLLDAVKQAEEIWSQAAGKELFEYDPKGKLTLNLIYDERQKTTQQNEVLKRSVETTTKTASSIKDEYQGMMEDLSRSKEAYNSDLVKFKAEQTAYSNAVTYWNGQGGAPPADYNKLEVRRNQLLLDQGQLEQKRLVINAMADRTNAFIQKYNLLVQAANANIDAINQTAGQEFQEGSYDPKTNTVNIYEFSTQTKLTRVLAHELGHALGLNHNNNSASIMYSLNQSTALVLTKDDIASLKTLCNL